MNVSIIGCGNIGRALAEYIDGSLDYTLCAVNDLCPDKASGLISELNYIRPEISSIEECIDKTALIIECAGTKAVGEIIKQKEKLDTAGKKLLVMSTGGIIENMRDFFALKNCKVYVPSGAVSALDAIKAVRGKIDSLEMITTKSAKGLANAPYVTENKISLNSIHKKTTLFKGNLKEAVRGFPQNINSAASLCLASQFDNLKIKVILDPKTELNTHEIICTGAFGRIYSKTENRPSSNPKTSYLAVLSALSALKQMQDSIKIV